VPRKRENADNMIARSRIEESSFRHSARGREPLAPPGAGGTHIHYSGSSRSGIGCITSRDKRSEITFFELLAYELKCNVATAKRLYEEGLIR
jgi:hypothetical protein